MCRRGLSEAVWYCLKARKFRSVLHSLDNPSNEVHFIKQCLSENEWAECNGECSYNQESGGLKCPIPTKSFQGDAMVVIHVHDQMVPILQFEVTGEKPTADKDVKKLSILSCWNMCYAQSTHAVEIGKDFANFIHYNKNRQTKTIDANSYKVNLTGNREDGKFSTSLVKFLKMLFVALDHAYDKEGNIYREVRNLINLGKLKPGSDIQLNSSGNTGKNCFLIPSMSYINDRKDHYGNMR